jgi:predicted transcriptional regulator
MNPSRIISFRIAGDSVDQLDEIARNLERDRSYVLNEAIEHYLEERRRFEAMVEEGREDIRAGRVYSHEEVERMAAGWAARKKRKAG